jgi:hypothetical protein
MGMPTIREVRCGKYEGTEKKNEKGKEEKYSRKTA